MQQVHHLSLFSCRELGKNAQSKVAITTSSTKESVFTLFGRCPCGQQCLYVARGVVDNTIRATHITPVIR